MANTEHVSLLEQGVVAWNAWRHAHPDIQPDLVGSSFFGMNLTGANFIGANLTGMALIDVNLTGADLTGATVTDVNLSGSNLTGAILAGASLNDANLRFAVLCDANLVGASLQGAILIKANFSRANLAGADLSGASLVTADFTNTDLTGCRIYGVSAWGLKLDGAKQQYLIITDHGEPEITVDNIEVAQFIYLLLHNPKIRDVIDTIGQKAVLILGRFTEERKKVLDAIREELRKHDYVPILFDFEKPTSQNLTATVLTLARLSRFVIADLTDPSSIPYELGRIVPNTKVPVQPLLLSAKREFAMFPNLQEDYHWVLPIYYYDSLGQLLSDLNERVLAPAERKVLELRGSEITKVS